ncbi:MAG: 5'/3'-nucleotidase SurE [Desulfobacterales bacterium]
MNLLLTNDDGIYAEGLWALHHAFSPNHRVTVVAPDRERSGVGHGITLSSPLRHTLVTANGGDRGHAVNGTPADCVKLGILEILEEKPDLVVSGINPGANMGVNLNYSGTVAAAREATLYGIPAIAASIRGRDVGNYPAATHFLKILAEKVLSQGLPFGTFLNVNIPDLPVADIQGVTISRQGISRLSAPLEKRIDPWSRTYYWQGADQAPDHHSPDVDGAVLEQDYISITPVRCDMTDYPMVECLKEWKIGI